MDKSQDSPQNTPPVSYTPTMPSPYQSANNKTLEIEGGLENSNSETSSTSFEENTDNESDDSSDESSPKTESVASKFLDELIVRFMTVPSMPDIATKNDSKKKIKFAPTVPVQLKVEELDRLCDMAIQSFMQQNSLLIIDRTQLPITIVGDLHGQFKDLRGIFHRCGAPNVQSYLFLGDYVDRGCQGVEVFSLLIALKIKYPKKVFMIRGNHEDANTCSSYGFREECDIKFATKGEYIWQKFINVFNYLPLAALINKSIFCSHGGLSPELTSLEEISKIKRPSIIPPYGLMCDLVWSDPDEKLEDWAMNSRGISFTFGDKVIENFCQQFKIDLIVRGHQLTREMLPNGYRFFAKGRLLTLFSAPNYLNMRNSAAILRVNKKMKGKFIIFKVYKRQQKA